MTTFLDDLLQASPVAYDYFTRERPYLLPAMLAEAHDRQSFWHGLGESLAGRPEVKDALTSVLKARIDDI